MTDKDIREIELELPKADEVLAHLVYKKVQTRILAIFSTIALIVGGLGLYKVNTAQEAMNKEVEDFQKYRSLLKEEFEETNKSLSVKLEQAEKIIGKLKEQEITFQNIEKQVDHSIDQLENARSEAFLALGENNEKLKTLGNREKEVMTALSDLESFKSSLLTKQQSISDQFNEAMLCRLFVAEQNAVTNIRTNLHQLAIDMGNIKLVTRVESLKVLNVANNQQLGSWTDVEVGSPPKNFSIGSSFEYTLRLLLLANHGHSKDAALLEICHKPDESEQT